MEIPAEIFQQLTAGGHFAPTPIGSESRITPRFTANLPALLIRLNGDKNAKPISATITDLSASGARLEFTEPIHVNDPFAIRLPLRGGSFIWIHCICVRWAYIDRHVCSIGAKFTGMFAPPKAVTGAIAPVAVMSEQAELAQY